MCCRSAIAGCAVRCLARPMDGGRVQIARRQLLMDTCIQADTLLERLQAVAKEPTPAAQFDVLSGVIRQGVPIEAIPAVLGFIDITLEGSLRYQAYAVWELAAAVSSAQHSVALLRYARRYTSRMVAIPLMALV